MSRSKRMSVKRGLGGGVAPTRCSIRGLVCGLLVCVTLGTALADDDTEKGDADSGSKADAAAQANNPLANLKAFNLHNYYIAELSGTNKSANQFWLRYAQPIGTPIGDWLLRASLPINHFPVGDDSESGLGDGNVFAAYLIDTGNPARSFGIGPMLGAPTATDDALGTGQWSAGLASVLFDATNPVIQWGALVTYQHKFAGSDRAPDVNLLAVQPFGFVQLGKGFYLRNVGIWAFNLQTGDFSIPVGLGLGKVFKVGSTVLNAFVEPQYSIATEGPGQPEVQIFTASICSSTDAHRKRAASTATKPWCRVSVDGGSSVDCLVKSLSSRSSRILRTIPEAAQNLTKGWAMLQAFRFGFSWRKGRSSSRAAWA